MHSKGNLDGVFEAGLKSDYWDALNDHPNDGEDWNTLERVEVRGTHNGTFCIVFPRDPSFLKQRSRQRFAFLTRTVLRPFLNRLQTYKTFKNAVWNIHEVVSAAIFTVDGLCAASGSYSASIFVFDAMIFDTRFSFFSRPVVVLGSGGRGGGKGSWSGMLTSHRADRTDAFHESGRDEFAISSPIEQRCLCSKRCTAGTWFDRTTRKRKCSSSLVRKLRT